MSDDSASEQRPSPDGMLGLGSEAFHALLKQGPATLIAVGLVASMAYFQFIKLDAIDTRVMETLAVAQSAAKETEEQRRAVQANNMAIADMDASLDKILELDVQMDKMGGTLWQLQRAVDRMGYSHGSQIEVDNAYPPARSHPPTSRY